MTVDVKSLIDKALAFADLVDDFIPGGTIVTGAMKLGRGVIETLSGLKDHASPDQQSAIQERIDRLQETVTAKANATSARARGE